MEKLILGNQDKWSPFQKSPTNALELILDYARSLLEGSSASDILAIINKHKEILNRRIGLGRLYTEAGMAGNSTIHRQVLASRETFFVD